MDGLHRRTEDEHESGAFLLGRAAEAGREVVELVYYDELDANAYSSGVCILHAPAFGPLWERCAKSGLVVVADAHVHPFGAWQSRADRENPMIARPGHLALIIPDFARPPVQLSAVGLYEYLGDHRWRTHSAMDDAGILRIGD